MSCCHYDEGYADGLEEGKADRSDVGDLAQAILDAARLIYERRGDHETADVLRECAHEIETTPAFPAWCERLRAREAELLALVPASSAAGGPT